MNDDNPIEELKEAALLIMVASQKVIQGLQADAEVLAKALLGCQVANESLVGVLDRLQAEVERLKAERNAAIAANRTEFEGHKLTIGDMNQKLADQRAEIDTLKTILAKLSIPCIYCGLEDMSKCERGFPGCAKADDLICGEDEYFKCQRAAMQGLVDALKNTGLYLENENKHCWCGGGSGHLGEFAIPHQDYCVQANAALAAVKKVENDAEDCPDHKHSGLAKVATASQALVLAYANTSITPEHKRHWKVLVEALQAAGPITKEDTHAQ